MALVGAAGGAALEDPAASTPVQAAAPGTNRANGAAGANGGAGLRAPGAGGLGGGLFGTVSKVDGNTITLTQRDGTTTTVVMASGGSVSRTVSGSLADLTAGTSIAVRGATVDGKTTAESITINPANGGGIGGVPQQAGNTTGAGKGN